MDLNEECTRRYRISAMPRWNYDLDAGTLVFSEEGIPTVIASIQVVGTTSTTSKTWLWGWANESLPSSVVSRVCEVRRFGETEGLSRLTEEQLPDDEYLGWEMTAIAARIIGAKGGYRFPAENGFMYVVYTNLRPSSEEEPSSTESSTERTMNCDTHGNGRMTFVCEHLAANPRQEWLSDLPTDANPWPDAWCAKCDEICQEQGGWSEDTEGRIKIMLLCHRCYESFRKQDPAA
jgi:hypothetical protein